MKQLARRSWLRKFGNAFRGIYVGMRGQSSFAVHITIASLVVAAAVVLQVSKVEWCLLVLCISLVFAAELFNTALEHFAKAIDSDENPRLRDGLDIASAAVLVAAIGAVVVGVIVFLPKVVALIGSG